MLFVKQYFETAGFIVQYTRKQDPYFNSTTAVKDTQIDFLYSYILGHYVVLIAYRIL
jgi:hypothetical protein